MSGLKPRVGLLGLLALLLLGSIATASAEAQGPFWYHRNNSTEGKGVKLSGQAPEEVRGGGGVATLEGKLAGTEVTISSTQQQVKGIIYNNALQGQAKLEIAYVQPTLVSPKLPFCAVTIASNNTVKLYGHQAWTWSGTAEQLKEQPIVNQKPDWIFTGQELQQGAKGLPKGVPFTSITFKSNGGTCILAAQANVTGSVAAAIVPGAAGEFSKLQKIETLPNFTKQHFWY